MKTSNDDEFFDNLRKLVKTGKVKTLAETGAPAGGKCLGFCTCNQGLMIQLCEASPPHLDADYSLFTCSHELEDCINIYNLIYMPES